ncbi:MAG: ABC transporter permease [Bacteroidales bacterium]|nr:ABC transporter permease [Bacteroidales bacterium]
MQTILFILQKEFLQIFRNKTMLPIIVLVPFIQLIILVNAATLEMKRINMEVVDNDMSSSSRKLVDRFRASPFFSITRTTFSIKEAEKDLLEGRTGFVLHIMPGFEEKLGKESKASVQLLVDAVNGMTASLTNAYAQSVISDYNSDMVKARGGNAFISIMPKTIDIESSYWYNPQLNFKYYMVPGILVILVSMIGAFLTALNIVREKETGTIEQINVTPIRKYHFIIGKLIPFWIIALFELAFGLFLGRILFGMPVVGSLGLLFLFASVYLLVVLGLGLLLSTMAQSQQQVMFLSFFFLITFILMSGIFTPAESMPAWGQKANLLNPFAYFMRVIRMILLKGSGFKDIAGDLISITIFAAITLGMAIWRYRKAA